MRKERARDFTHYQLKNEWNGDELQINQTHLQQFNLTGKLQSNTLNTINEITHQVMMRESSCHYSVGIKPICSRETYTKQ